VGVTEITQHQMASCVPLVLHTITSRHEFVYLPLVQQKGRCIKGQVLERQGKKYNSPFDDEGADNDLPYT
jgi:hypothetical protein